KLAAPAFAARPVRAAAGKAAAATTSPASRPQIISAAAFATMLRFRLRIQFTGPGYGTSAHDRPPGGATLAWIRHVGHIVVCQFLGAIKACLTESLLYRYALL